MAVRTQSSLSIAVEKSQRSFNNYNKVGMGKVINTNPTQGTVDISTMWGGIMRDVKVVGNGSAPGTRQGTNSLPQVLNADPKLEREGKRTIDEYGQLQRRDTQCIFACIDGNVQRAVCWILPPDYTESSFPETNQSVDRTAGDSYTHTYSLDNPTPSELKDMIKNNSGQEDDETKPAAHEYPRKDNWEQVFSDRRRLKQKDTIQKQPAFEPADESQGGDGQYQLGLETYSKIGFGYDYSQDDKIVSNSKVKFPAPNSGKGGVPTKHTTWTPHNAFVERPWSAQYTQHVTGIDQLNRRSLGDSEQGLPNYDQDIVAWRRHRENGIGFARGRRFNQRWGTFMEQDKAGNTILVTEGLNKNVNPEQDQEDTSDDPQAALMQKGKDWGSTTMLSRIEERHTAKGEWAFFRKRWKWGGQLENFETAVGDDKENDAIDVRRWGQTRTRTQRTWQAVSRKEAFLGARGTLTIAAGKADDEEYYEETSWGRKEAADGGDFSRYQDRDKWRNPDSDESGNILIQSIRPKLSEFQQDKQLRGDSDGGTITLRTRPLERDNAKIELYANAARNNATLLGYAQTGQVAEEGEGDNALVDYEALAYRDNATMQLWAKTGVGGSGGDNALNDLRAESFKDNAIVTSLAHAGVGGQGDNAENRVTALAEGNDATATLEAKTDNGNDATAIVQALPAHGTATVQILAESPDSSRVLLLSLSEDGSIDATAADEITITATKSTVTITAGRAIVVNAPSITLNGDVVVAGNLSIEGTESGGGLV